LATLKTITFIGAGRLAVSLARLWHQGGVLKIRDIMGSSVAAGERAVAAVGAGRAVQEYSELAAADFFLVATPDRAVTTATLHLASTGILDSTKVVFHCSGAESSDLLAAARSCGASVGSAHPLTSFAGPPLSAESFAGVFCGIEGDPDAAVALRDIFLAIGGRPVILTPERKILYHAAAVFGSNYLVTLLETAMDAFALAGIESQVGLAMIEPLVRRTVENVFLTNPRAALTGPIARGDEELVRRQYRALYAANPSLAAMYRLLGARTALLAGRDDPFGDAL